MCGNFADITQNITINDTTPPTADALPDLGPFECSVIPAADINVVLNEADNCGGTVTVTFVGDTGDPGCSGTIVRTYRLTDDCGNTADINQNILINDNIAPTADALPDLGPFACYTDITAQNINDVTGETDNCGGAVTVSFVSDGADPGCSGTVIRTYRLTDVCGNTADITQNIFINDNVDPTFNEALPADVTVSCSTIPTIATLTASDNCGSTTVTSSTDAFTVDNCNGYTIVYRWVATDDCGNTTNHAQTITVIDNVDPEITCPPTSNIECNINIPAAFTTLAQFQTAGGSVSDDCGINAGSFTLINETTSSSSCPKTISRTYQIADDCGNTSTCVHTLNVTDTQAPVIHDVPANVNFPCSDCIQSFLNGGFEEPVQTPTSWSEPYFISWGGFGNWIYWHEDGVPGWETTATDNRIELHPSGFDNINSAEGLQHAELNAHQNSDLFQVFCTVPTTSINITFAHAKRSKPNNTSPDIMVVLIGDATLPESTYTTFGPFTQTQMSTWTYHLIDYPIPVGQSSTKFIFRAVQGSSASILEGNLIDDIDVVTLFDPTNIPYATDNCDFSFTQTEQKIDGFCDDNYQLIRTWTAIDGCGNQTVATQEVTVGDFIAPELIGVPNDVTVDCDAIPDPPTVTANDNCDPDVPVTYSQNIIGSGCTYTIQRTWSATDDCNLTTSLTQTITVQDTTAPVFVEALPSDITAECSAIPTPATLTATDNCNNATVSFAEVKIDGACSGEYTLEWTWTATDDCSNAVSHTQTVTVTDNTNPSITCPANVTVECRADIPSPDTSAVTATDLCGIVTKVFVSDVSDGNTCPEVITRTYRATDDCGNSATCTQTITIDDITDPVISCPPDTSYEGWSTDQVLSFTTLAYSTSSVTISTAQLTTANGSSSDNCGVETITYTDVQTGSNPIVIQRTFVAIDSCNNTAQCIQTITIEDVTPPK